MESSLFERMGRTCAEISIRFRWLTVLFSVVLCLGIASGASTLQFAADYRVFFGENNPDFLANDSMEGTFGRSDNIVFVLIPKSGSVYTENTLSAIHALTEASWSLPYVSRVDSLTNFQNTIGLQDDLIVEDLLFDPSELSESRIASIRETAEREPLINGFAVSRSGEATVISATVQLPKDIPNVATMAVEAAREVRAEIQQNFPEHDIHITGLATLSAAFEEAGLRDASTLTPAVYIFILIVMLAILRSFSAVFSSLMVIALSTLVGMGIGGLLGVELTPISLAAPTIILTIAVADAIHVIAGIRTKFQSGADKREAIVDSIALNFAPIGITSLTTVLGFLTLNFSDSPPFHHLGNMSAAGIAAAWVLSVTFLPALLSLLPLKFSEAKTNRQTDTGFTSKIAESVIRRPGLIATAVLFLSLIFVSLVPRIEVNDQWTQYFGESLEFRQAIDASNPHFGAFSVEFVMDPGEPGGVTSPDFLNTVDQFTSWIREQEPEVAHVFSISDIIKRLNKNLNGDQEAYYRIPDNRELASQYLLVYELSLPYGLDLNNRVDIDRRSTRISATMNDISTNQTRAFVDRAQAWFDENGAPYSLDITGSNVLFAYVAERNIRESFEGALYLVLAIFIILSLAFRSVKIGLLSLIPNVLPIATAFGVWALLVGVVGFSVAAVGAVAVGLIVDFTVHFLAKYLRARLEVGDSVEDSIRYAFRTAGVAILLTTVILAAGFSVLVTSAFKLNADLGLLTAIAVVLAMLINFLLLPALFMILERFRPAAVSA